MSSVTLTAQAPRLLSSRLCVAFLPTPLLPPQTESSLLIMASSLAIELHFLKPLDLYQHEEPYWPFAGKPVAAKDADITNVELESISDIPLHDVRNHEQVYELEMHGFQFIKHDQTFTAFEDAHHVEEEYLPRVEKVILDNVSYATRVYIFDWRVRRSMLSPPLMHSDCDIVMPADKTGDEQRSVQRPHLPSASPESRYRARAVEACSHRYDARCMLPRKD